MKKMLAITLMLFPLVTLAQQDMMAQMQEMATCMQSIDQKELKILENESKQFNAEIKVLCENGKRDQAQAKAVKFSQKMMNSPVVKTMHKCTEKMPASMRGMMPNIEPEEMSKDYSKHHVCDKNLD